MNGYSGTSWWGGGQYDANQDWLDDFNRQYGLPSANRDLNYERSNAFYNRLTSGGSLDPTAWLGKASGYEDKAAGIYGAMDRAARSSEADKASAFLSAMPGLEQYASRVTQGALGSGGSTWEELARGLSASSRRDMENRLGASGALGVSSGAAARAISGAAQEPLMNALASIAQTRAQAYSGAINPLAQMAYQGIQNKGGEYAQILQALSPYYQGSLSMGSNLASLLGQQSEQAILAPDIRQRTGAGQQLFEALLAGGAGALSGGGAELLGSLGSELFQNALQNRRTPSSTKDPQFLEWARSGRAPVIGPDGIARAY